VVKARQGGRRWRRAPARSIGLVALTVAVTVLAGPAPSVTAAQQIFPPTGFGGYRWFGSVNQISASWPVPDILSTGATAEASTWVGAQPQQGGYPFIQLGTLENSVSHVGGFYEAFWSDTAVDFHPQFFGAVSGGDTVTADMRIGKTGWTLVLADLTKHKTYTQTIHYGVGDASGSYNQAEWLQEDPAPSSQTATDLPYPQTSTVRFTDLKVDRRDPHLGLANGQVLLATNGVMLVPSAVTDDGFTFATPLGAARTYLLAARQLDAANSAFALALSKWSSMSKKAKLQTSTTAERAIAANAVAFQDATWPQAAQADVHALVGHLQLLQGDYTRWIKSGMNLSGLDYSTLLTDSDANHDYADRVRNDLGLPPI
jgi:hypothetical protein